MAHTAPTSTRVNGEAPAHTAPKAYKVASRNPQESQLNGKPIPTNTSDNSETEYPSWYERIDQANTQRSPKNGGIPSSDDPDNLAATSAQAAQAARLCNESIPLSKSILELAKSAGRGIVRVGRGIVRVGRGIELVLLGAVAILTIPSAPFYRALGRMIIEHDKMKEGANENVDKDTKAKLILKELGIKAIAGLWLVGGFVEGFWKGLKTTSSTIQYTWNLYGPNKKKNHTEIIKGLLEPFKFDELNQTNPANGSI